MSNAELNSQSYKIAGRVPALEQGKFDKTGGDISGPITVNGGISTSSNVISIDGDHTNLHLWMRDGKDVERAVIWHESATDSLRFRVREGSPVVVDKTATMRVNRIVPENTNIAVHCPNTVRGADGGMIRGQVEGGGWDAWRERAAGLHVDAQLSEQHAHNIIRATHWNRKNLFAMGVHSPSDTSVYLKFHLEGGQGQEQFTFRENGQGFAVGGWHTGSDSRFKDNIEPLSKARISYLDKVCALNASSFVYRGVGEKRVGFIAQNVQEVIPAAVSVLIDTTLPEEDQADSERLYIDPIAIIAAQNEAIKELRQMVEDLRLQINR